MKKILFISKTILSIALIATVVTVAHAWTAPTAPATGGNVPAPLNTGNILQAKAEGLNLAGNLSAFRGFFSQYINSPKARLGCFLITCSITTLTSSNIFEAGSYNNAGNLDKGVIINSGGGLQISSGLPGVGKVLTSVDNAGTAVWADGSAAGGSVTTDGLIQYVRGQSSDVAYAYCGSTAGDDSNWIAIGGGGDCYNGIAISQPIITRGSYSGRNFVPPAAHGNGTTNTPAIGWAVYCLKGSTLGSGTVGRTGSSGDARAEAICMKRTTLATTTATTSGGGSTGGGTGGSGTGGSQNLAWHNVPSSKANGTDGQTCASWLTGTPNYDNNLLHTSYYGSISGLSQGSYNSYDSNNGNNGPANGGCMYTKTVGATKYCIGAPANVAYTATIGGTSYGFAPTAACPAGSITPPVGSLGGFSVTGTTQIKY